MIQHVKQGDRVLVPFGADEWAHGRVWRIAGEDAWVSIIGGGIHVHREPVDGLVRVCGTCPDCRALNQMPGCLG